MNGDNSNRNYVEVVASAISIKIFWETWIEKTNAIAVQLKNQSKEFIRFIDEIKSENLNDINCRLKFIKRIYIILQEHLRNVYSYKEKLYQLITTLADRCIYLGCKLIIDSLTNDICRKFEDIEKNVFDIENNLDSATLNILKNNLDASTCPIYTTASIFLRQMENFERISIKVEISLEKILEIETQKNQLILTITNSILK